MSSSNRTTKFLIFFLIGFLGCLIGGLIEIWLFPMGAEFNIIVMPKLFGFSLIAGLIIGLFSTLVGQKQVIIVNEDKKKIETLEERVRRLEEQLKKKE